jgi:hypothetical protein
MLEMPFFAGRTPLDLSKTFSQWWKNDTDEGGKNLHEFELLQTLCSRLGIDRPMSYHKITQIQQCQQLIKNLQNHTHEGLTTVVYNFVDMISHAKTEMEVIKELAPDNKAYRSLTASWFKNSPLKDLIKKSLKPWLSNFTYHGPWNDKRRASKRGDWRQRNKPQLTVQSWKKPDLSTERRHPLQTSQKFSTSFILRSKQQLYFCKKRFLFCL